MASDSRRCASSGPPEVMASQISLRDTVTDKFVTTYKAGEPKPEIERAANDSGPAAWANRPPDQLNVKKPARKRTNGKGDKA